MSLSRNIRILMIDDHNVLRAGLRMLLESDAALQVIGEACTWEEARHQMRLLQPDLVLMDLDLDGTIQLERIPELQALHSSARFIVLTGLRDPEVHARVVKLGVEAVIHKESDFSTLLEIIHASTLGQRQFNTPPLIDPLMEMIATLTPREREIISLVFEGLKNQEIGHRLFISEGTVRNHLTVIYEKLHLSGRFQLVAFTHQHRPQLFPTRGV